jgi:hypothetical protein
VHQSGVHVCVLCLITIRHDSNVGLFLSFPSRHFGPSTDVSSISRVGVVEAVLMAFDVSTIVPVNGFVRDLFCVVDRIPAAPSDVMTGNTVQAVV